MRRNRNTYWCVSTYEDYWYFGRKHGWKHLSFESKNGCSSYNDCYTKSRALRSAANLRAVGAKEIIATQISYKNGKRFCLEYKYN